jgi:hypothetical protein
LTENLFTAEDPKDAEEFGILDFGFGISVVPLAGCKSIECVLKSEIQNPKSQIALFLCVLWVLCGE